MFFWSSFPFIRLVIPFGVGIYVASTFSINFRNHSLIALELTSLFLVILFYFFNPKFKHSFLGGLFISALALALGASHFSLHKASEYGVLEMPSTPVEWFGEVVTVKKEAENARSFLVVVKKIYQNETWEDENFKLLVFNRDSTFNVNIGDLIGGKSLIKPTMAPQNPAQFNYQTFLSQKNVFFSTYEDSYIKVDSGKTSLLRLAEKCRAAVIDVYRELGIEGDNFAVLVALTLGDKTFLDFDLQKKYAGAGAMHILAVSGLHVGIVFLIFSSLLTKLPDRLVFRIVKSVLLLLVIWAFAFLAGLSPSVQRAGWMFSFVILSKLVKRNSNILNSIAVSAFFLLLINPNNIFQVGFQLSYSAVVGIVLIHPPLYRLVYVKYWLFDKAWSLLVVSIAAQAATLPFTMAYFHQFPNYFLLANLFVIPLAFAIVMGAVIVVPLFLIFGFNFLLPVLLSSVLSLLNGGIEVVNELPYAVSKGLWFHPISIGLIVGVIFLTVCYLHFKTVRLLALALILLIGVQVVELYVSIKALGRNQITFYALTNPTWSVVKGNTAEVFFLEEGREYDKKMVREHLQSIHVSNVTWNEIKNEPNKVLAVGAKAVLLFPGRHILKRIPPQVGYVISSKYSDVYKHETAILFDYYYRTKEDLELRKEQGAYYNFRSDKSFVTDH
ncbi:MAG: competence protein ComEC [Vicingaceae bacterium]